MSRAEDRALEHCCAKCTNNKLNCGMKLISHGRNCFACSNYIEGYHQAEKDLELTYDDICEIMEIREDVLETDSYENLYEEILKRFKERKEK